MQNFSWVTVPALVLAVFFVVGSLVNGIARPGIRADYARWGYPAWFPFVTAALEGLTAVLLVVPRTRAGGAGLGLLVMLAAVATVLRHREWKAAIPPSVAAVLCLLALSLALNLPFVA